MDRSQTWGDPHPSDIGDVPPVNPGATFQEVNYTIQDGRSIFLSGDQVTQAPQDIELDQKFPISPRVYHGVVHKQITTTYPYKHEVILQDGRTVTAISRHVGSSHEYDVHAPVTVVKGNDVDEFVITTLPGYKILSSLQQTNSTNQTGITTTARVEFDTKVGNVGDEIVAAGNSISTSLGGLHRIDFSVTIELEGDFLASYFYGVVASDFTDTDATAQINVTNPIDGDSPTSPVTVNNPEAQVGHIFQGLADQTCKCIYNPDNGEYFLDWVEVDCA